MKIKEIYTELDKDGNGTLDLDEVQEAIRRLEMRLSREEFLNLIELSDLDGKTGLSIKEFIVCLAFGYIIDALPNLSAKEENPIDWRANMNSPLKRSNSVFGGYGQFVFQALLLITSAYLHFDTEGKGHISRDDLRRVMVSHGNEQGVAQILLSEDRWNEMDWDHNGNVDFGEFVYAFTKWVDIDEEN